MSAKPEHYDVIRKPVITKGKSKRFRGMLGRRKDVKKAYVTLEEGNTIDVTTGL
jgi:large subunit ribosomal protein L23